MPGKILLSLITAILFFVVIEDNNNGSFHYCYLLVRDFVSPPPPPPPPPPPAPPVIDRLSFTFTYIGDAITDGHFTNTGALLDEVNVVFTAKTDRGEEVKEKRYWVGWKPGETKDFHISLRDTNSFVEKITLTGTCTQGRIDSTLLPGALELQKKSFDPGSKFTALEQGQYLCALAKFGSSRESLDSIKVRQQEKVKALTEELTAQYQKIAARRPALKEEELEPFNKEAATYAQRLQGLRNEEAFLKGLEEGLARR